MSTLPLQDLIERHLPQLRRIVCGIFRGAVLVNLVLVPASLLMGPILPEVLGLVYLAFYYLIWLFLPAACLTLVLLLARKYHLLAGLENLTEEMRFGKRALLSYGALMLVFLLAQWSR